MDKPAAPGPLLSITSESPRAPLLYAMFGRLECIPVTNFYTDVADLPDRPGQRFYTVAHTRLSYTERENLLKRLMNVHRLSRADAEKYLECPGIIIYAEDCTVSSNTAIGL